MNSIELKQVDSNQCKNTLGVHMGSFLEWVVQFAAIKEKMGSASEKLRNTVIVTSTASLYYNMHLIANVYFGCEVIH